MAKENTFDRIGSELKRLLGLPEEFNLQFLLGNEYEGFFVRIQGPHSECLDYEEDDKTKDILGLGTSMGEAIENACALYRNTSAEEVVFFRELAPPSKTFQH